MTLDEVITQEFEEVEPEEYFKIDMTEKEI